MAYVTIPKDLSRIQSKVLFGLTKRQVICFGAAAHVLDGKERLELLYNILHPADGLRPEGGQFAFE